MAYNQCGIFLDWKTLISVLVLHSFSAKFQGTTFPIENQSNFWGISSEFLNGKLVQLLLLLYCVFATVGDLQVRVLNLHWGHNYFPH